jgi:hypothetical protein
MNVCPIIPVTLAAGPQPQKASPSPASAQSPASTPQDTVSLSPAAQKTSQSGDFDHDGGSH